MIPPLHSTRDALLPMQRVPAQSSQSSSSSSSESSSPASAARRERVAATLSPPSVCCSAGDLPVGCCTTWQAGKAGTGRRRQAVRHLPTPPRTREAVWAARLFELRALADLREQRRLRVDLVEVVRAHADELQPQVEHATVEIRAVELAHVADDAGVALIVRHTAAPKKRRTRTPRSRGRRRQRPEA